MKKLVKNVTIIVMSLALTVSIVSGGVASLFAPALEVDNADVTYSEVIENNQSDDEPDCSPNCEAPWEDLSDEEF